MKTKAAIFYLTLLAASAVGKAGDYVDDGQIKNLFRTSVLQLHAAEEGLPTASKIRQGLLQESRVGSIELPSPPELSNDPLDRARDATLVLGHLYLCDDCDKWHTALSSAIMISPRGLVLTNFHVLDFMRASKFGAMTFGGDVYAIASVLASSRSDDLALLQLAGVKEDLPFASIESTSSMGDDIFVISHPDSHFYSLSKGIVSRFYLDEETKTERIQITADVARGSSGAGIFNQSGFIVGLVTSTRSIHFSESKEKPRNLQMVLRSGVPISSLDKLIHQSSSP